ncbi:VanZ family protein [Thalassotalea sp. PS06]|uniref:VanZ family protein n=1 Tax=Thalassotalea sp. PS06 TaxID=2594005 RepID=UPI0021B104DF|nr:VanZ family protein [Thalassotalea sp. PS06]
MSVLALAFFAFVLWVIYLANIGNNNVVFQWVAQTPYGDKLGHLFIFGFLTLITNASLKFKTVSLGRVNTYLGTLLVSVFVLAEEFSQGFLPTRSMDIQDVIADAIGIIIFTAISHIIAVRTRRQPALIADEA